MITRMEVLAYTCDGRRLIAEIPAAKRQDDGWRGIAQIRMPAAELVTTGWKMGVQMAREIVQTGLYDKAAVEYIASRGGTMDMVRVHAKWDRRAQPWMKQQ